MLVACAGAAVRPAAESEELNEMRGQIQAQSALLAQQQRRIEELEVELLAFVATYPQHSAADNALYLAGLIREVRGDCAGALQIFESLPLKYPAGDAVPQAQLERGRCLRVLGRKAEAKAVLNQLSAEHPQAPESAHSRQLLQGL